MRIKREIIRQLGINPEFEEVLARSPKRAVEIWIRNEYAHRFEDLPNILECWEPTIPRNMKEKRAMGLAK